MLTVPSATTRLEPKYCTILRINRAAIGRGRHITDASKIMDIAKHLVSSVRAWRDNLGRAFVVITLIVCVYQIWRRWREKRAIERNVRGKVVLITGASSGLGEGTSTLYTF